MEVGSTPAMINLLTNIWRHIIQLCDDFGIAVHVSRDISDQRQTKIYLVYCT